VIHDSPDGDNINRGCGATQPESLMEAVQAHGADVGFALDGDADRCVAVDAAGRLVDGDQVLGILALERLARGALPDRSLVVSVLSNGGLQQAVEAVGGRLVRTPVGDKHILAAMLVSGAGLGGEKSGHVIVREHALSGDGILTAIELLRVMTTAGTGLGELARTIPLLPQQQRAIRVRHRDQWEADDVLQRAIAEASARLAPHGRILVRPSGTEPVLRVMVEGTDADDVAAIADAIAALAGERLH
jgi:phosphoglucosamine mutase